jgi:hypothetical protein
MQESNSYFESILDQYKKSEVSLYYSPTTLTEYTNVYMLIPEEGFHSVIDSSIAEGYQRITPLGLGLSNLIEEEIKTTYSTLSIGGVLNELKRLIEVEYELVRKIESNINDKIIGVKLTYHSSDIEKTMLKKYLRSLIACALAKNQHKPIILKLVEEKENVDEIEYEIKEWEIKI